MAADDVALAAVALKDNEVRRRVQEGDMTALGTRDLSPEEAVLVRRLAEQGLDADVEVFETSALFDAYVYCQGKLSDPVLEEVTRALPAQPGEEVEGYFVSSAICRSTCWGHCSGLAHAGGAAGSTRPSTR